MIVTLPFPIPINQEAREYISLDCVFLVCFIYKMPCRMLRVRWNDIVLVHMCQLGCKTGNYMALYMSSWDWYLIPFLVPY